MKALLIISHGSRVVESNAEVLNLAKQIRRLTGPAFPLVELAFLETSTPGVQETVSRLIDGGATEILLFPLFLSAGAHVIRDIPNELLHAEEDHPDIKFTLLSHLGALEELPSLIVNYIRESAN